MQKTVASHTLEQLAAWGVPFLFGVAGDSLIPLLEAIRQQDKIRYIGVRHEESAGFMASAYAKLTGEIGVCMAEAGPASVHLLNGVYDAHMDRVPLLAITGQNPTLRLGTHWPQTINQDLLYEDATCFNHTLATEEQHAQVLAKAMRAAVLRKDAARIGLPVDLQAKPARGPIRQRPRPSHNSFTPDPSDVQAAARMLNDAERPLLFVGQGARGDERSVLDLAETLQAPIVHTMPALGIVSSSHPRNLGVIGEFGTEVAAQAFAQADTVLVIGSTWWQPQYVPDAKFIQIDSNLEHIDMLFPIDVGLHGRCEDILPMLSDQLQQKDRHQWEEKIHNLRSQWDQNRDAGKAGQAPRSPLADGFQALPPMDIVRMLSEAVADDAVLCLDVGDSTYWISSLFQAHNQHTLISGHWRSMGFALPAAIAAQLTYPERQVVAVAGDGGFAMTMAEFATAVYLELPITVVVFNNRVLATEGHKQALKKLEPFAVELHNPDFAQFATSCGGEGLSVDTVAGLKDALSSTLSTTGSRRGPVLINVATQRLMPAYPKGSGRLVPKQQLPKERKPIHV